MLCKYASQKGHYYAVLSFFYGANSPLLDAEPTDELFEALDKMLSENAYMQRVAGMIPGHAGFQPGGIELATYVAWYAVAILDLKVPINVTKCLPFSIGLMTPCVKYDNVTRFRTDVGAIRTAVALKFRIVLEEKIATAGESAPCANEQ